MARHLNTEELLLLADGELSAEQATHFDVCVECQAQLGALQGDLTAISSALTASNDGAAGSARSWARLEEAITQAATTRDLHLSPEELLLLIDGELSIGRAGHAKRCVGCSSAQTHVQNLLHDVESDLRTLAPSEPIERRLAAEQALRQYLYAAEQKVVAFPARPRVRYAVAAAAMISVAAGGWLWNQQTGEESPAVIAEAAPVGVATLAVAPPVEPAAAGEMIATAIVVDAEPTVEPASAPERFELTFEQATVAEPVAGAVLFAPPSLRWLGRAPVLPASMSFRVLPMISMPVAESSPEPVSEDVYVALLEARQWQLKTGLWREDVRPAWREGRVTFTGTLESASARGDYIAAMVRQADGRPVDFDLAVRPASASNAIDLGPEGTGVVGGLVRTALLEHYRDAARRSFRSTDITGLEAEMARYVSEVFSSQNDLVAHSYELDQLLNHSAAPNGDAASAKTLVADLVRFHVAGAGRGEATIYDHLSEALPRRYWRYQGEDGDGVFSEDLGAESKALLTDVLSLERTLSTVLTGSNQTVAFESAGSSSGELLRRIHDRLDRIRDLTRSTL